MSGARRSVKDAWNANACWWQQAMGEGDEFHEHLIYPALEALLALAPGERVLDIACGHGNLARRLARAGAAVVAVDFSQRLLELARAAGTPPPGSIDYRLVDVTDRAQLASLRGEGFDAAVCSMALHDMEAIDPLLETLPGLLRPGRRLVFVVPHPCFNTSRTVRFTETSGMPVWRTTYGVRVTEYLDAFSDEECVKPDQSIPQRTFHRSLERLFGACFRVGFVLDGLLEPAPPPEVRAARPERWELASRVPQVLAARWRAPGVAA